jgi:hypothetical protein
MASSTNGSSGDAQLQQQNLDLRTALSDAYAAVQGAATTQSFSAITFEELANAQIQRINGPSTQQRPNVLDSIQAVLNNLTQAVAKIQAMPPESFVEPDADDDVNTPDTTAV